MVEFTHDHIYDIMSDCAKLRGCYPLTNRTYAQFFEWLMVNKQHELMPLAMEFREHCNNLYSEE